MKQILDVKILHLLILACDVRKKKIVKGVLVFWGEKTHLVQDIVSQFWNIGLYFLHYLHHFMSRIFTLCQDSKRKLQMQKYFTCHFLFYSNVIEQKLILFCGNICTFTNFSTYTKYCLKRSIECQKYYDSRFKFHMERPSIQIPACSL